MSNKYGNVVWSEVSNRKVYQHVFVWERFMGVIKPEGCVIHHLDENKLNNDILNLVCVEDVEHRRWHNSHRSKETLEKKSRSMKGKNTGPMSEEHKMKLRKPKSDMGKKNIGEAALRRKGVHHSDATKEKIGKASRGKVYILVDGKKKLINKQE